MRLIDSAGFDPENATVVPEVLRESLRRWYHGQAGPHDLKACAELFALAEAKQLDLVCDCLGKNAPYPPRIAVPDRALGKDSALAAICADPFEPRRSFHAHHCPFYADPVPRAVLEACRTPPIKRGPIKTSEGLVIPAMFNGCGNRPLVGGRVDTENLHCSVSALQETLMRLLDAAHCAILDLSVPVMESGHDLKTEFGRLHHAARQFSLAPDLTLDNRFHTGANLNNLSRLRVIGKNTAQLALIAFPASQIRGPDVVTPLGNVTFERWMSYPGGAKKASGPFLVLGVVYFPDDGAPVRPQFAIAVPIALGNRFFPVTGDSERDLLRCLRRDWAERNETGHFAVMRELLTPGGHSKRPGTRMSLIAKLSGDNKARTRAIDFDPEATEAQNIALSKGNIDLLLR